MTKGDGRRIKAAIDEAAPPATLAIRHPCMSAARDNGLGAPDIADNFVQRPEA
jgi:hypothetical protein